MRARLALNIGRYAMATLARLPVYPSPHATEDTGLLTLRID